MDNNIYLLAAFVVVWGVTFAYLWVVIKRQERLKHDVEELLRRKGPSD